MTMGSNILCQGMYTLLDDIIKYMPSPENREVAGINLKTNEIYHADYDFAKAKSAYIWKTIVDPFIGKYSLIVVNSGVLKTMICCITWIVILKRRLVKSMYCRAISLSRSVNCMPETSEHWRS